MNKLEEKLREILKNMEVHAYEIQKDSCYSDDYDFFWVNLFETKGFEGIGVFVTLNFNHKQELIDDSIRVGISPWISQNLDQDMQKEMRNFCLRFCEKYPDAVLYWEGDASVFDNTITKSEIYERYREFILEDQIVFTLNEETGEDLTVQHFNDWMEGGAGYEKFDNVVKEFLGENAYEIMEANARMYDYLLFKLGLGPDNAGGIKFLK